MAFSAADMITVTSNSITITTDRVTVNTDSITVTANSITVTDRQRQGPCGTDVYAYAAGRAEGDSFRVMAVETIEITALQKHGCPVTRSIDNAGTQNAVNWSANFRTITFHSKFLEYQSADYTDYTDFLVQALLIRENPRNQRTISTK
jgi:hypothetical protein